jgi:myo-inositol 2-dehydrogenase/D-chiro-inositol 1-dehydrogenase
MIGADHIRRLSHVLAGAQVVAVADVDAERAKRQADEIGASQYGTGEELIARDNVDAVLVASWGPTHEPYVLASIAAGKPVFCEKPLATTQDACLRIIQAEADLGRRLAQVGYMRRYDAGYRAMKAAIDDGLIGSPTMVHSVHRNPTVPDIYTSDMAIVDTAVHDIDITRWLLGEEIVAAQVLKPRQNSRAAEHLVDPLLLLLESESGVLVDVEVNVNIGYGYDIRGEVVGETGTVALGDADVAVVRANGVHSGRVSVDWRERFVAAYDVELQEWVDSVAAAEATGPSAWDGYAVACISDAALQALNAGARVTVDLADKPALYEKR